jgi:ribokinase
VDQRQPTDGDPPPTPGPGEPKVLVAGQIARDLVLQVEHVPGPGGSSPVSCRRETLGGKGANQAVGMAQLGLHPTLLGVVGDDGIGTWLVEQAERDGIDISHVARRVGARSGLIVDVVDAQGWRYLEHLPDSVQLTEADVQRADRIFKEVAAVTLQAQQPGGAVLAAAQAGRRQGCLVVLDGAPADHRVRQELFGLVDVLRADAHEASLLVDEALEDTEAVITAADKLRSLGPEVVVLGAGREGNVVSWREGTVLVPLADLPVVDTTGGGDAFVAALVAGLVGGQGPLQAVRAATVAAGLTVGHLGGRPQLDPVAVQTGASRLNQD